MSPAASKDNERGQKRRRSENDPPSNLGRRRAACQTCRNRKVKCDLQRPSCSLCEAAGKGDECIYLTEPPKQTLESVAETLNGRFDLVTRQLEDLKAALQSSGGCTPNHRTRSSFEALSQPSPMVTLDTLSPVVSSHIRSPPNQTNVAAEPSRDFSHIPAASTTADTVLTWPIFDGQYRANYLVEPLLSNPRVSDPPLAVRNVTGSDSYELSNTLAPLDDERIPGLVEVFLQNVHTKNPVLDVDTLVRQSREASLRGLGWDAWSCCILLACALGCIAKPFQSGGSSPHVASPKELQMGEQYFILALRRTGLLKQTVLACQCHFFAGVYLMYTLRPMLSYERFHQAAITYQLYLKTHGRLLDNFTIIEESHAQLQPESDATRRRSRLEQRLYWSCFKSEAEFRVELPLPQSEIAEYDFPKLFPSPPSPPSPVMPVRDINGLGAVIVRDPPSPAVNDKTVRQTESWYYYLTEVALRRIGNRIINTFFAIGRDSWMHIEPYLDIAVEFEAQVSTWYANLPSVMQHYETNSSIKAPRRVSEAGLEIDAVSQELSWATENRLLEMRSWLYQPFLYYLIHAKPQRLPVERFASPTSYTGSVNSVMGFDSMTVLWRLIMRGIECNLTILETRSLPHRHHGLWYDLRAITCASFILLAIVRSGYVDLIPGGVATLLGPSSTASASHADHGPSSEQPLTATPAVIGGHFGKVLNQLRFWADESPEMVRHADALEHLITETML
jgi:hypothetical protein